MAGRLSFTPKNTPIHGRTEEGLSLQQAILDTTAEIRRTYAPEQTARPQNKSENTPLSC